MRSRCPNAKKIGNTVLENYRLVYKGIEDGNAYLTIEETEGYTVPLGVFEVTKNDIESLDKYEGYPTFYAKRYLPLKIGNKKIKALIYVMQEEFTYHIPTTEYVKTCLQGYDDFGFDKLILHEAKRETIKNIEKQKKLKR